MTEQETSAEETQDTARIDEPVAPATDAVNTPVNPYVDALARDIGPRPAGSTSESDAADFLKAALGAVGLPAARLSSRMPRYAELPEMAIAVASLVAILIAILLPPAGLLLLLALLGLVLAETYGYLTFARWLPAGESSNVLSIVPPSESEIRRIIVTTTIDTGKTGLLSRRQMSHLYAWLHVAILLAQALAILLTVAALARGNGGLSALFAIPALILIAMIVLLGERELAKDHSPGAITNASGMATLIELAGQTVARPPRWLEVWFLGVGASQISGAGIADFLQKNTFDPDITYFVHLQSPGGGAVTVPKTAGAGLQTAPAAPLLAWILDSVRAGDYDPSASVHNRLPVETQAYATHRAGYQSIVVAGVDESGRIPFLNDLEDLPYQVNTESISETVTLLSNAIDTLDREVAARAMLARSSASIQDTAERPAVSEDLPSADE